MNDKPLGIFNNLTSYGDAGFSRFLRRAFLSSAGFDKTDLAGPVIGIIDTSSDYNTCHRQMPEMVNAVKRGVLAAGGLPLAFPTISLHEILTHPTTMLFRNLMAMDTEEMIRAQPMDAVVLLGGCDKTVPAQIMGAVSAGIPFVQVVAGPMLTGYYKGERLGACTDCRRLWAAHRAGTLSQADIEQAEAALCFTGGTCMVMGTASTMACLAEALGIMLPGGATPPHPSGERLKQCVAAGRQAVRMAKQGPLPKDILTPQAFKNAVTVLMALGGSTNAIVHLLAIARRTGVALTLKDFNAIAANVPVLVDVKPAGIHYLEDFHHAGGMPALLKELMPLLELDTIDVSGQSLESRLAAIDAPGDWQTIIRPLASPLKPPAAITCIFGSLAPDGAVIKTAATTPDLLHHQGPAVVFESPEDAAARIDDPALGITPAHVMVLRNAGPVGAGMPEAGSLPIPRYLAEKGVKDMVRVSDARMSGTAYGTVVLHCSPEAAKGGPLAFVKNGDLIELNLEKKRIDLHVSLDELARRQASFKPPPTPPRGWARLYAETVLQAHEGADLDFL